MDGNIPNDATADDLKSIGLPPSFTLDQLVGFTTEEIAAMAQGDDPLIDPDTLPDTIKDAMAPKKTAFEEIWMQEDGADDGAVVLDAEGNPVDQGDEGGDEDGAEDGSGDADAGADADPAAAGTEGQEPDAAANTPDPTLDLKPTADLDAKIAGFDDALDALSQQYEDAELTEAEYKAKLKALTKEQADAQVALDRITAENQAIEAEFRKGWNTRVQAFAAQRPELIDQAPIPGMFDKLGNPISGYSAFDSALKHITGDPGMIEQYGHLSMAEKIKLAGEMVDQLVLHVTKKPLPGKKAAAPQPQKKTEKPGPRQDKRPEPVTTLGGVIAATENDVDDSRFAAIDKLEGVAYEKAVAKLSPDDRAAFLERA